jgi:hypothetical protein
VQRDVQGQHSHYLHLQLKGLQPSSEYEVSVRGKTVELGSAAVLKSVRTPLVAPDVGSHLNLVQGHTASTTLQVLIPAAGPFLTRNR